MYITNLDKKIDIQEKPKIIPTICSWSDLLGFSTPFVDSNWHPNVETYNKIAHRLIEMQNICARNLNPMFENSFVSNDAIIRNLNFETVKDLFSISMWFRGLLYFHLQVNTNEKSKGLPGMRTVVSGGERLLHNMKEVTFDDFVFNYTKPDPNEKSHLAQTFGDHTIMYNHGFMQMNTAFSKSYIIDTLGSSKGIFGTNIYLDESFFEVLNNLSVKLNLHKDNIINEELETTRKIAFIQPGTKYYFLGFEVDKLPIIIDEKNLKTKVYKLNKFYPWDEDPNEFYFNSDDEMMPILLPLY